MRLKEGSIKRCAIFLYYDKQGIVDDYVIYLLNDLNKNMTYFQMPVKFSKSEGNGELYVFTNKKNLARKTEVSKPIGTPTIIAIAVA